MAQSGQSLKLAWWCARFDDVEGESALELHAGCTKDGTKGARRAALLADDLPDIAGSDVEPKYRRILLVENLYTNRFGVINQRAGNLR
jgi:hypothetical protein